MSRGARPARAIAARAAAAPSSDDPVPGSTKRRSRIPVRWTIQSSVVSIILARSAFVTTRGGSARPVPRILAPLMRPPSDDEHGRGDDRRVLVLHDRRLGDVEGPVDLPADLPDLLLLVPALVLVELDPEGAGEHRRGQVLGVVAGDFFGLPVGVVLAQVAVNGAVRRKRAPDRRGDEPPWLVADAPAHDHEHDLSRGEILQPLILLDDPAFGGKDARHLDEVELLDPRVAEGELEGRELFLVAPHALGEEYLGGHEHRRNLL